MEPDPSIRSFGKAAPLIRALVSTFRSAARGCKGGEVHIAGLEFKHRRAEASRPTGQRPLRPWFICW